MKNLSLIATLLAFTIPAQAKQMSACHHTCFKQKYQCNINKSYTFNNCDGELSDCRIGCESKSGKKQYASTTNFPFDISF
jgi:hypothetical protein